MFRWEMARISMGDGDSFQWEKVLKWLLRDGKGGHCVI
jgi:hypothetical protein